MPRFWMFGQSDEVCAVDSAGKVNHLEDSEVEKCPSPVCEQNGGLSSEDSNQVDLNVTEVKDLPSLYYAVALPSIIEEEAQKPLVFEDKKEALKAVKKYAGARFKVFHTQEDAIAFASQPVQLASAVPKDDSPLSPPVVESEKNSSPVGEKPSQFKAPKSQDLVKLRKAIVAGDVEYFKETVWSNPRYLISFGDTPSILQEGFRYNSLHVAAKHKQPELCQLILDTIENPAFMELLYPEDTELVRKQRISYVLDLYLNMPDKGLCETPLHFASKIGCLEAVQILSSHPSCDKERRNRYGLLACEIICERCPSSSIELKQQIEEAFEKQYFVPVLRSEDNSLPPSIGKPCSKENVEMPYSSNNGSPCNSVLTVKAFAGPMSPKQADTFYRHLKTPPARFSKLHYNELKQIRLCDTEKGIERIGRDLAHNLKAKWTEYWPSLNAWCDLSSSNGLQILENHLRKQYQKMRSRVHGSGEESEVRNHIMMHSTPSSVPSSNGSTDSSGISKLCCGLQNFHMYDQTCRDLSPGMCPTKFETSDVISVMKSVHLNHSSLRNGTHEFNSFSDISKAANHVIKRKLLFECNNEKDCNATDQIVPLTEVTCEENQLTDGEYAKAVSKADAQGVNESPDNSVTGNLHFNQDYVEISASSVTEIFGEKSHWCLPAINSIILCILDMFSTLTFNSESTNWEKVHELAEEVLPKIKCLVKSYSNMERNLFKIHSFIAQQIYKKVINQFLEHEKDMLFRLLTSYLEYYSFVNMLEEDDEIACSNKIMWFHLKCVLQCFCVICSTNVTQLHSCQCIWNSPVLQTSEYRDWENLSFQNHTEDSDSSALVSDGSDDDDDDADFSTPLTSPYLSCASSDDDSDEPVTPDEGLEVYVDGEYPSKADVDILRAIEDVPTDPIVYPYICRWKHLIECKEKTVIESWPSPALKQYVQKNRFSDSLSNSPISPLAVDCDTPRKFFN